MLLQTKGRLEDKIVLALADIPNQTACQLYKRVATEKRAYSIQALYKELRKLQKSGVTIKSGKIYSLRLPWLLNLLSLAENAVNTNTQNHQMVLPKKNERFIWHFKDLLKMNDFWSHLLLVLIQRSNGKVLLGWNPHPWFHLVQTEQEKQYIKSLRILKSRLYLIVGGNNYLDRAVEKFLEKEAVKYSFHKNGVGFKRTEYINCIDDFVVTIKISEKTTRIIDKLYDSTEKPGDIDISAILKIFHQPTTISVWLENKAKKARSIRVKFKNFFGPLRP